MAVNLVKGQKVELRKESGDTLKHVMVGLGWDEVRQKRGLFAPKPRDIDCDASVFLCIGGKLADVSDIVYYGNLTHKSGAVRHMGDNLTGAGEGDDEQVFVDLSALPPQYDKLVFTVNIYQASSRKQQFGMVENAFIRICDTDTGMEFCRFNLSENYDGMTAMIVAEVYRHNGTWKFSAVGQPTRDDSITDLAKKFL